MSNKTKLVIDVLTLIYLHYSWYNSPHEILSITDVSSRHLISYIVKRINIKCKYMMLYIQLFALLLISWPFKCFLKPVYQMLVSSNSCSCYVSPSTDIAEYLWINQNIVVRDNKECYTVSTFSTHRGITRNNYTVFLENNHTGTYNCIFSCCKC